MSFFFLPQVFWNCFPSIIHNPVAVYSFKLLVYCAFLCILCVRHHHSSLVLKNFHLNSLNVWKSCRERMSVTAWSGLEKRITDSGQLPASTPPPSPLHRHTVFHFTHLRPRQLDHHMAYTNCDNTGKFTCVVWPKDTLVCKHTQQLTLRAGKERRIDREIWSTFHTRWKVAYP